jgi:DNA topoisomerase I
MDVVIVESPAKAKTINKYLGRGFVVLPSYGHVRDLPSKEGSVEPDKDFAMHYATEARSFKHMKAIASAIKGAKRLFLATDPDREGEAISWHVLESLQGKPGLKDLEVKRVVFHEITKTAVLEAMKHPRDLDLDLVNAQQARRALDYLVGFTLSPVLWRKLPGARSAGRVQSVALRLVCEREMEIEVFIPREYWSVDADLTGPDGSPLTAHLIELDGKKLDKFDLNDGAKAEAAAARITAARLAVRSVEAKPGKRHPAPPFTTSTLQQEAARKLGFSAQQTMSLAQRLYEGAEINGEMLGLITYMRTDGVQMANEAIRGARDVMAADFGADFVPSSFRVYTAKTRNAQEAHEAIRPTDFALRPGIVARQIEPAQARLYELIWKRAMASQMENADIERTAIDIADERKSLLLRATGTVITFPGFLKLYEEGHDENGSGDGDGRLPKLNAGDALQRVAVKPEQHFTQPPPRFSEASLVKRLEELGIGRPSTYASILGVLRERNYVRMDRNRFIPEDKGRLVTAFLDDFFEKYFAYDFTANLEDQLDEIAERRLNWKEVLRDFWISFSRATSSLVSVKEAVQILDKTIGSRSAVIDAIDATLGPHFFPPQASGADPRACAACGSGRLGIKLGRNGPFVGCSNYPTCGFTRPLSVNGHDEGADANGQVLDGPKDLGVDPVTGLKVTLRAGPYGPYVQLGETPPRAPRSKKRGKAAAAEAAATPKPKRASLPKGTTFDDVTLQLALRLLALPREVGLHPVTRIPIRAGIGRFGPYLEHDKKYARLSSAQDALDIGLNHAVELVDKAAEKGPGKRRGPSPLRAVGNHPDDGKPIEVMAGRYGPYIRHGKINAPIPKDSAPETIGIDAAVAALAAKAAKGGNGGGKRGGRRKSAA